MGNHRAERRGSGRRPSDHPTPLVEAPTPSAEHTAEHTLVETAALPLVPVAAAGKRRAEKPSKATRAAKSAQPTKAARAAHASGHTAATAKSRPAPARRATKHT